MVTVVLGFITLQDKHNIHTLSENIKFICTHCETGWKSSPKVRFPLNELHKRTIGIVFIQRESSSSKKNLYPDAQKKKFPQKNLFH